MDCWFTKHDVRSKRKRRVSCFPFHRETKSKTQDVFPQSRFLILHQPYLLLWRNTPKLRVFLQAKSVTLKIHGNLRWRVHVEIYTRVFCLEICHVAVYLINTIYHDTFKINTSNFVMSASLMNWIPKDAK